MVDLVGIALILGGLVLLIGGATLSVYGVAILGIIVGGGTGYLLGPTIGGFLGLEGLAAVAAATVVGMVAGVILSYVLLSMAVALLSFVAGTLAGLVILKGAVAGLSALVLYPGAIVIGFVAAALGSFMTKSILVLVTSFVGASLVSRSLTLETVETAGADLTIDPLIFELSPLFLGLFVLGVLLQFGIFKLGYVTKIVAVLPGASVLRDNRSGDTDD